MTTLDELKAKAQGDWANSSGITTVDFIDRQIETTYNARTQEVCEIIDDITAPEGAWREALEGYKKVIIHTIKALSPEVKDNSK